MQDVFYYMLNKGKERNAAIVEPELRSISPNEWTIFIVTTLWLHTDFYENKFSFQPTAKQNCKMNKTSPQTRVTSLSVF